MLLRVTARLSKSGYARCLCLHIAPRLSKSGYARCLYAVKALRKMRVVFTPSERF